MDIDRLYEILGETAVLLRKGAVLSKDGEEISEAEFKQAAEEGTGGVFVIDAIPSKFEIDLKDYEVIDCHMVDVAVNKAKAEERKDELFSILEGYDEEAGDHALKDGPSYIHVGAVIGDQGQAFKLFAVGKVLGFWGIITPATMGLEPGDPLAQMFAGSGGVMISGFKRPE